MIRDYTPMSKSVDVKHFLDSRIHMDYLGELDLRIEHMRDSLEDPQPTTEDGTNHEMTRGAIKVLREIKDIFTNIYNNASTEEEL